ncbi:hypothetical protein HZS_7905 [Henneguya salminicola]|nr:hypothetical protein HZS_7905 [Henneguya salminicola]
MKIRIVSSLLQAYRDQLFIRWLNLLRKTSPTLHLSYYNKPGRKLKDNKGLINTIKDGITMIILIHKLVSKHSLRISTFQSQEAKFAKL